ncbi:hypothetical protein [Chloroflexus sp.]|nr:hypothetical protein [Chloroflexus sp.]
MDPVPLPSIGQVIWQVYRVRYEHASRRPKMQISDVYFFLLV